MTLAQLVKRCAWGIPLGLVLYGVLVYLALEVL